MGKIRLDLSLRMTVGMAEACFFTDRVESIRGESLKLPCSQWLSKDMLETRCAPALPAESAVWPRLPSVISGEGGSLREGAMFQIQPCSALGLPDTEEEYLRGHFFPVSNFECQVPARKYP